MNIGVTSRPDRLLSTLLVQSFDLYVHILTLMIFSITGVQRWRRGEACEGHWQGSSKERGTPVIVEYSMSCQNVFLQESIRIFSMTGRHRLLLIQLGDFVKSDKSAESHSTTFISSQLVGLLLLAVSYDHHERVSCSSVPWLDIPSLLVLHCHTAIGLQADRQVSKRCKWCETFCDDASQASSYRLRWCSYTGIFFWGGIFLWGGKLRGGWFWWGMAFKLDVCLIDFAIQYLVCLILQDLWYTIITPCK